MPYQIPTIPDEDLDLAVSPAIGAESRLFASYDEGRLVAEIEQDAVDLGTIITDRTYRPPTLITDGRGMQLICNGPVLSDEEIVATFNVVLVGVLPAAKVISGATVANPTHITTTTVHGLTTGDTVTITGSDSTPSLNGSHIVTVLTTTTLTVPVNVTVAGTAGSIQGPAVVENGTATATFTPPATGQDGSFNFPPGLGVDLVPVGDGYEDRLIRTVTSIASVDGGRAGNKFHLMALPAAASYFEIMCVTDKSIPVPISKSIAIACRFNGARWVKKGVSEAPNAEFKAKYGSYGDGLARINGHRITVKVETRKDDRILTERLVLTGWRPTVSLNLANGEAEAEATAAGMYEIFAAFV